MSGNNVSKFRKDNASLITRLIRGAFVAAVGLQISPKLRAP